MNEMGGGGGSGNLFMLLLTLLVEGVGVFALALTFIELTPFLCPHRRMQNHLNRFNVQTTLDRFERLTERHRRCFESRCISTHFPFSSNAFFKCLLVGQSTRFCTQQRCVSFSGRRFGDGGERLQVKMDDVEIKVRNVRGRVDRSKPRVL